MRNSVKESLVAVGLLLAFSSQVPAQTAAATRVVEQRPPTLYQKLEKTGPGGPAPHRDLLGSWTGPLEPQLGVAPPMTPMGEARYKLNIPDPFSTRSNDPWGT